MKLQLQPAAPRRGVALIVVLSVMALIVVYVVTAQIAVTTSHNMKRVARQRIARAEATTRLVNELARPTSQAEMKLDLQRDGVATAHREALAAGHPALADLPGLAPRVGDALVTIAWVGGASDQYNDRYLINTAGARHGAIRLPRQEVKAPAAATASPEPTAAGLTPAATTTPVATASPEATATASPTPTETPAPTPAATNVATTATTSATPSAAASAPVTSATPPTN